MSKRNSILSIILLFAFLSVCYLSISQIQTDIKARNNQENIDIDTFESPKISQYSVTELWNCLTNNELVLAVAVSADGKYIAVGTDTRIIFFNNSYNEGIPMWSVDTTGDPIESIAISENGSYIIAASTAGWGYLFNSTMPELGKSKEAIWIISGYNPISSVDISADGKYIVVGGVESLGTDSVIELYNNSYSTTGNKKSERLWWYSPTNDVLSVAISADGNYIVAGTDDTFVDTIFFFNNTDYSIGGEHSPLWSFDTPVPIDSIAISEHGNYTIAGSSLGMGFLFNSTIPDLGDEIWYLSGFTSISSVDISADGKYIVVGASFLGGNFTIMYNNSSPSTGYDKTFEELWSYQSAGCVNSVTISSADGEFVVAGTDKVSYFDTIYLLHNKDYIWGEDRIPTWSFDTGNNVTSVSMSEWGTYFASGGFEEGTSVNGRISLFYHVRPGAGGGDDDDGDGKGKKEGAIPFGNYYLLFAAIALICLIIIKKRKTIFYNK